MNSNDNLNNNIYSSSNLNTGNGYTQPSIYPQQSLQNKNMNTRYMQSPVQNLNGNGYANITSDVKSNKNKLLIVIVMLIIAFIAFLGYQFFFKDKTSSEKFDINQSTVFFLQNADSKYALFNEEGKRLTEFVYKWAGTFVNGTAIVETEEQEGIINSEGKLTVPFGKYKNISSKGGLYKVREITEDSYNSYLINGSGKILYNLKEMSIYDVLNFDTFVVLDSNKDSKYIIVNYNGKELLSFSKVDGNTSKPSIRMHHDYISIYYNNRNWIFNVVTGEQIASFASELSYCINDISDDKSIIILESYVKYYDNQDKTYYKFIKHGKLYDMTENCDSMIQSSGNLFCYKEDNKYLLDSNLNIAMDTSDKAYRSVNDYIVESQKKHGGVDFYQDGKMVKSIPCRTVRVTGYMSSDVYLLGTFLANACGDEVGINEFYKANGEKLIEKSFKSVNFFDSNNLSIVSEDKINYYLLDETGKQVGSTYDDIFLDSSYYRINKDNLYGIMDKNGKEIVPCAYSSIYIITHYNKRYAKLKTLDSRYIIYDLDNNREILNLDAALNINNEHYIEATSNGKTQYYTYGGKLFFEQ